MASKIAGRFHVLVVDEHPLLRRGVARVVASADDLELSAQTGSAAEAVRLASEIEPDVTVADLSPAGSFGFDTLRLLVARSRVLAFSAQPEAMFARPALAAGARGYLMKTAGPDELLTAVRTVAASSVYASDRFKQWVLQRYTGRVDDLAQARTLSARELEVFSLIGRGLPTREIAKRLYVSVKTVESHRHSIKRKLGVRLGSELAVRAATWVHHERPA